MCNANLADDVAGLYLTNGLHKLLHGAVIVAFGIQMIPILSMDVRNASVVQILGFGKVERNEVERFTV